MSNNDINRISKEVNRIKGDIQHLQSMVNQRSNQINQKSRNQSNRLKKLQLKIEDLSNQVALLEKMLSNHDNKLDDISRKLDSLISQISTLPEQTPIQSRETIGDIQSNWFEKSLNFVFRSQKRAMKVMIAFIITLMFFASQMVTINDVKDIIHPDKTTEETLKRMEKNARLRDEEIKSLIQKSMKNTKEYEILLEEKEYYQTEYYKLKEELIQQEKSNGNK